MKALKLTLPILILFLCAACGGQMADQPRYEPLEPSTFFEDGKASRDLVAGTVARGQLHEDTLRYAGRVDGQLADTFPFPVTMDVLERGQERFDIYCAPCHGYAGYGDGMIVQRGFSPPPSFHEDRLRAAPVGYYFDVITNGFGAMYSYRARIRPDDRWAIIAYVRALQYSQNAPVEALSQTEIDRIEAAR